jgi:Cd2+/Zn2+-exporting ATPase
MDIRPDYANVKRDGEEIAKVHPKEVYPGDTIIVKPGEKIPLDGIVITGSTNLDVKALTGESLPKSVEEGDVILSGSLNIDGLIEVRVTKKFGDSTISKILEMVEKASSKKLKQRIFITRFARYYTPIVVLLAAFIAVVPSLFTGGEKLK